MNNIKLLTLAMGFCLVSAVAVTPAFADPPTSTRTSTRTFTPSTVTPTKDIHRSILDVYESLMNRSMDGQGLKLLRDALDSMQSSAPQIDEEAARPDRALSVTNSPKNKNAVAENHSTMNTMSDSRKALNAKFNIPSNVKDEDIIQAIKVKLNLPSNASVEEMQKAIDTSLPSIGSTQPAITPNPTVNVSAPTNTSTTGILPPSSDFTLPAVPTAPK